MCFISSPPDERNMKKVKLGINFVVNSCAILAGQHDQIYLVSLDFESVGMYSRWVM